jgi:hypothetical protein
MNKYTMARFDPEHADQPLETRAVTADSETEACTMLGEPIDGSYWTVIDTEPETIRYVAQAFRA